MECVTRPEGLVVGPISTLYYDFKHGFCHNLQPRNSQDSLNTGSAKLLAGCGFPFLVQVARFGLRRPHPATRHDRSNPNTRTRVRRPTAIASRRIGSYGGRENPSTPPFGSKKQCPTAAKIIRSTIKSWDKTKVSIVATRMLERFTIPTSFQHPILPQSAMLGLMEGHFLRPAVANGSAADLNRKDRPHYSVAARGCDPPVVEEPVFQTQYGSPSRIRQVGTSPHAPEAERVRTATSKSGDFGGRTTTGRFS